MEFTTAHLQFVKSTAQLLARTTINNFKQPLKTEFKKNSHILMGSEIFLSEISSQVKYNFKIKLYYVKIQRNIARATSNEIKFPNSKNNIFFKLITCFVHINCPVIIITTHLLFLKVKFLVKPNAYLLGNFAAPAGRITSWPGYCVQLSAQLHC